MQVWHAVAERLVVHLPCSNSTLHSRGDSRHLQQVPTARPDLQLEEVGDALSSDVEDRTTVVLSRIELFVSVRKASDRVTVRSRLDLLDLRAVGSSPVQSRAHHRVNAQPPCSRWRSSRM